MSVSLATLMCVIDRIEETRRLREAADNPPQLVVMRGRRRVGKSYLIDQSLLDRRFLYYQADEGEERNHLDHLAREVSLFARAPVNFPDWNEALVYLARLAESESLVVAFDEFQWMRKAQPLLPSIIMRHFDEWERHKTTLTLIVSGSALTLMEELLEGDKPMFGRSSYRPLVEPFDYRNASEFGPSGATSDEKLKRYAILGGTAQYQVWAGSGSIKEILTHRILAKGESLFEEPLALIRGEDEIREPGNYYEILRAVAQGATKFNEVVQQSKVSSSQVLTQRLKRLETLRYIEDRKPIAGNGNSHYEIADPFFRFWFNFVYPNRSRLQRGRVDEVCSEILSALDNFMGFVFEQICRDWAGLYASASVFPSSEDIGAYWTRTHDIEIDVVGKTGRKYDALGSCKWSTQADTHDLDRLVDLRYSLRGVGDPLLYIFARGFHKSLIKRASNDGVTLVHADDLFH